MPVMIKQNKNNIKNSIVNSFQQFYLSTEIFMK